MDLRGDDCKRTAHAPAKLNLFLNVFGRRSDGFHDLETLMVPVRLADQVTFTASGAPRDNRREAIELIIDQLSPEVSAPHGSENLIVKALELLQVRSGCALGGRVQLTKRIPISAGLGGGSSDAAAALRLANRAWRLDWPLSKLALVAAELGSDVPFFLTR